MIAAGLARFLQPTVVIVVVRQCKVEIDGPASLDYRIKRTN